MYNTTYIMAAEPVNCSALDFSVVLLMQHPLLLLQVFFSADPSGPSRLSQPNAKYLELFWSVSSLFKKKKKKGIMTD